MYTLPGIHNFIFNEITKESEQGRDYEDDIREKELSEKQWEFTKTAIESEMESRYKDDMATIERLKMAKNRTQKQTNYLISLMKFWGMDADYPPTSYNI